MIHQNNVIGASYKCTWRKNGMRYKAGSNNTLWAHGNPRCFVFIISFYSYHNSVRWVLLSISPPPKKGKKKETGVFKRLLKLPKIIYSLWQSQDPHPTPALNCKLLKLCDTHYLQRNQYRSISTYLRI